MNDFAKANLEWQNKKNKFIDRALEETGIIFSNKAERVKITYTIPKEYKEEIDAIILEYRKKADNDIAQSSSNNKEETIKELSKQFELRNPAPHMKDF